MEREDLELLWRLWAQAQRTGPQRRGPQSHNVPRLSRGEPCAILNPMSDGADRIEIVDNPGRGRFEIHDAGGVIGVASYAVVAGGLSGDGAAPDRVVFFHTEVRPEYEGQGLAARLASFALDATV